MINGTQGYVDTDAALVERYERIPFPAKHRPFLPLLPDSPVDVLDVGAGTGADAAYLAKHGHRVVAVEPSAALRGPGMALHAGAGVDWIDDALPDLAAIRSLGCDYGLILLSAVWMHLDTAERARAMPLLAELARGGGLVLMTLRHVPVPAGRRMFEVGASETVELAADHGLDAVLSTRAESLQQANRDAGVAWSFLAFQREGG